MDERNEQPGNTDRPADNPGPDYNPVADYNAVADNEASSTHPTGTEPDGSFGGGRPYSDGFFAYGHTEDLQAPESDADASYGSDSYIGGGHIPGGFPQGGYDPGVYGPGVYGPATYGPPTYGPAPYGPAYGRRPYEGSQGEPGHPRRGGRKATVALAAALALLSAGAGAGIAYVSRSTAGSAAGLAASPAGHTLTTSQIAAEVDPAVVDIDTNLGEGTGIIANSSGEIITNNHVIEGASTIKVLVDNGGTYNATVVGTDASADVAVLDIKANGLPTVKFGNSSDVVIGTSVVAIGNAGGQGFPSAVTAGAVTALGRTIVASDDSGASETLKGMIQMDALIEPGNSGGPLVDSYGDVIGIDTAAASSDGATPIGFALPINRVLTIATEIEHGKAVAGVVIGSEAYLGIAGQTVSREGTSTGTGVGLEYVGPGTPAAAAGIEAGDVIVAFDGHATANLNELATLIHKLRPGDRAQVTFDNLTGGTQTVTVTLGSAPPA